LDLQARNLLIEQSLPRIQQIAAHYSPRLPPGVDAADLVNETVARVAAHLDRGLPWSWARVDGAMLDFLRGYAPARRGEMPAEVRSAAPNPEELAIRRDTRRVVRRKAATLSPKEQVLLRLASKGVAGARLARELRVSERRLRAMKQSVRSAFTAAPAK